jgi:hydrogenase maturation protease
MTRVLIIGYGNTDRQDDGVAWHILAGIGRRLGRPVPVSYDDEFDASDASPRLMFVLQLTPELAETLAEYERVCFVDAHTGNVPDDLNIADLASEFQTSPFTHHMTPATCLALARSVYGRAPRARLVSVRGYEFGFSRALSSRTAALADQAIEQIMGWLRGFYDKT